MSNTETSPREVTCTDGDQPSGVQILTAREAPLGGPRALLVRRTLPQRARTLIGAWCFADHYGPDTTPMVVPPHPHTGLQTVSWLFDGEIEHRDSGGHHLFVRPGELNLMTGGRGIAHSEVSTDKTETLHGVQLWVALPDEARDAPRDLQSYRPEPVRLGGAVAKVFLGSLAGTASPVRTYTPLLGAELVLDPGAGVELSLDETFEHGILLDQGELAVTGVPVNPDTPPSCCARGRGRRRASCCWAGRRSARRSSCGGTSSVAATTRSSSSVPRGRQGPIGSVRSTAMSVRRIGCPHPRCPTR